MHALWLFCLVMPPLKKGIFGKIVDLRFAEEYVKGFEDKTLLNPRRRVNSSSNRLPSKEVETKNSSEAEEEIGKTILCFRMQDIKILFICPSRLLNTNIK